MEGSSSQQFQKQNPKTSTRSDWSQKDLWHTVRDRSLANVELALAHLKKNGGNINLRNAFGSTPLHIATWRNHIPIVKSLLAAGADPDARDGESGWSSLHRALHFGHLAVASVLIQSGASVLLEDSKSRTPIDLISGPVLQALGNGKNSVETELLSWGSGVNYQLGTGNVHIQKSPCKVDCLRGVFIKLISAGKFHSVAVSADGEVYTWGFGRGGRLGHSDFDIHNRQAAIITPRKVTSGLGSRRVRAIAAAKHHTVIATEGGEVFTWGSNREGQLGYTSVDTQPTPRRISSLKLRIVSVAAANKHTAVVSECGSVFTWGCNREGQLGYGTSNSASNYTPRAVECLKGKTFTGIAAAKYHTIVLGTDGEVFTWGHRLVTPKRVIVARNIKKSGSLPLKFHRMERLHVVSVAAGTIHSMALTDDGALFYWASSDPDFRCQQLYSVCGRKMVNISSGKYWTGAVTDTGNIYMWDSVGGIDKPPVITRLQSVKKATAVAVGETHMMIVESLYHPVYLSDMVNNCQKKNQLEDVSDELEELDENFMYEGVGPNKASSDIQKDIITSKRTVPSLKSLCEKVAGDCLVEPRNSLQMLEIADSLGADNLRKHCEDIAIRNLDYIITVSGNAISNTSLDIFLSLEKLLDSKSSEQWSHRRLPTPTTTFPAIIESEVDESESELLRTRNNHTKKFDTKKERKGRFDCFALDDDSKQDNCKQVRALRKKLQQIQMLEEKQSNGYPLDDQQIAKLHTKVDIESLLFHYGITADRVEVKSQLLIPSCGKGGKKEKHRRKSKHDGDQGDAVYGYSGGHVETDSSKNLMDVKFSLPSKDKAEDSKLKTTATIDPKFKTTVTGQVVKESFFISKTHTGDFPKNKSSSKTPSKKKKRGGLSMFLRGALDDIPKAMVPPIVIPKNEGPVWGGVKNPKGSASLRAIQNEQSKMKISPSTLKKNPKKDQVENSCVVGKIQLNSLVASNTIPVVVIPSPTPHAPNGNTPPWVYSCTLPPHVRPKLKDIQIQQGKHQDVSHSLKTTTGFLVPNSQGSPMDSPGLNRWFKPDSDMPSSIRSIQIEEKAMKDLKRFYSSVKIVKNQL